eukprot:CCRYP_003245-RA/>CCRYP_003245-RA protein AED:0.47 eAED:0.47 QI:0/0/0/1/0/0/2/0/59
MDVRDLNWDVNYDFVNVNTGNNNKSNSRETKNEEYPTQCDNWLMKHSISQCVVLPKVLI